MRTPSLPEEVTVPAVGERPASARRLKRWVQSLFWLIVLPRLMAYRLGRRVWGQDRALIAASESIARIPGMRGVYARQAFYRQTLAGCGRDVYLGWGSVFSMTVAEVHEGAYIGRGCRIGYGEIGPGALLADGVQVLSGGQEHGRSRTGERTHRDEAQTYRKVTIGRGAWIGTNAVIMADVGEGAIVGAGAVVSRPIPAWTVAVGVPARVVKELAHA